MWDDLSVTNPITGAPQGLVIAEEQQGKLLIHYVSVPEFISTGTNYFTVELDRRAASRFGMAPPIAAMRSSAYHRGGGAPIPGQPTCRGPGLLRGDAGDLRAFLGSFGTYGGVDLSFEPVTFRRP